MFAERVILDAEVYVKSHSSEPPLGSRRFPRWRDVRPFLRLQPKTGDAVQRQLAKAHSVDDLRKLAARRTPKPVFDYVDGAAESEVSARRSHEAFGRVEFHPHVLRDVASVDSSTTILGHRTRLPIVLGPTGFTRMMHTDGEAAVATAAANAGVPYALSTMGTTSVERVRAAAPDADVWFQRDVWRDRGRSKELIDRAREAGVRTLVLTVDVPVAGARLRDVRGGLTIPPTLTLRTLGQIARFPSWWFNLLTSEPLNFASIDEGPGTLAEMIATMFDPSVTMEDVDWLRGQWDGPVVVKGVQRVDDAQALVSCGVDGIVLSNHGGRQLDRSVTPLELLPRVLDAVNGRREVFVDGGVRSGADVVAAIAAGATACLIGRAYLYGLMAGGQRGVARAIGLLSQEVVRTMQLLGATSISDLTPDLVSFRAS